MHVKAYFRSNLNRKPIRPVLPKTRSLKDFLCPEGVLICSCSFDPCLKVLQTRGFSPDETQDQWLTDEFRTSLLSFSSPAASSSDDTSSKILLIPLQVPTPGELELEWQVDIFNIINRWPKLSGFEKVIFLVRTVDADADIDGQLLRNVNGLTREWVEAAGGAHESVCHQGKDYNALTVGLSAAGQTAGQTAGQKRVMASGTAASVDESKRVKTEDSGLG